MSHECEKCGVTITPEKEQHAPDCTLERKDPALDWVETVVTQSASTVKIIESQANALERMAETIGQLMLLIEDGDVDSPETRDYIADLRAWLLDLARLRPAVTEALESLKDAEVLRRLL